jgi:hypothetical protein
VKDVCNVNVELITTMESNKKIILSNQCRPADCKGGVICGLSLLLEKTWAQRDSREKPSELRLNRLIS